jgi:hypothetical protein
MRRKRLPPPNLWVRRARAVALGEVDWTDWLFADVRATVNPEPLVADHVWRQGQHGGGRPDTVTRRGSQRPDLARRSLIDKILEGQPG